MKKRKLKLKRKVINILKIIFVVLVIFGSVYFIYRGQVNRIIKLGYSEIAAKKILFDDNKDYFLTVKNNKTLNAAMEGEDYQEKYIKNYAQIDYYDYNNLIKNINIFLSKGYSNSDINIILAHGNDDDISQFAKKDKVRYLEDFYQFSFAKLKYYDRYLAYIDETGEDERTTVIHVNLNIDKIAQDESIVIKNFSYSMLVNKYYGVDKEFVPDDLIVIPKQYSGAENIQANRVAVDALSTMFEAASVEGLSMKVNSAYRSYDDQLELIEYYRKWYGNNYVNNYVSKAGFSEHQTGLAFDIGSTNVNIFANSNEYVWMKENAYKYGFVLRFPSGAEVITGYKSEPWHFRYVGKEIAKFMHDNNIVFEEYYVMFLDK